MDSVMSFSKDKHERFCRCLRCSGETKHQKIRDDDLNFEEELVSAINRRK